MRFYVYLYRCPRAGHPVYVGKGCGNRAWSHLRGSSNAEFARWLISNPDLEPEIIDEGLSEDAAYAKEAMIIKAYGRLSEGGTLFNVLLPNEAPPWTGGYRADVVLSRKQCAEQAGVSISTMKRVIARGELKPLRMSPRRVGIRRSEFMRWLASCEAPTAC